MNKVFSTKRLPTALLFALSGGAMAAPDALTFNDPFVEFQGLAAAPESSRCGSSAPLTLPVDLSAGINLEATVDAAASRLKILYRTNFNQVTEGWNWHPEARPEQDDYYRFKYLPLGSYSEEKAAYRFEDKIGDPQDIRVTWRYDYFFAFDNLYDFFPRSADDDAGFQADIPMPTAEAARLAQGDLRVALRGRLSTPCTADSTTFWKATHAVPVDFTLKKRYLLGRLEEIWFYDAATQKILARLPAKP